MSVAGEREQREREVMATLLLRNNAYTELPENFPDDAFEFPEYRKLFGRFRESFIETGESANIITLGKKHPELQEIIREVTWATSTLNGEFKGRAAGLMNHRPPLLHTEERPGPKQSVNEQFHFDLLNGMDIASMEIPPESHLIKGLIPDTGITFLSGEEEQSITIPS